MIHLGIEKRKSQQVMRTFAISVPSHLTQANAAATGDNDNDGSGYTVAYTLDDQGVVNLQVTQVTPPLPWIQMETA